MLRYKLRTINDRHKQTYLGSIVVFQLLGKPIVKDVNMPVHEARGHLTIGARCCPGVILNSYIDTLHLDILHLDILH